MNRKLIHILFPLSLAILLAVIVVGCSKNQGDRKTEAAKVSGSQQGVESDKMNAVDSLQNVLLNAPALYVCPMHAEFVSADPNAKCPICGMNTEKMSEEQVAAFRTTLKKRQ
jgi:hypothetical protein